VRVIDAAAPLGQVERQLAGVLRELLPQAPA
jgi:hypothetical protein